ncbi:anaphase-promoting complex subunit ApcB [Aspergillus ambiguus]|uniref:anaphase promoting complex subunit 2 n=1 Tax=Aspergillus ambiguus TaxID=176160 RepID=UPI003CCCFFE8
MASTEPPPLLSRRRVFTSVFSPTTLNPQKTRSFEQSREQTTWERAWHLTTRFLSLPDAGFTVAQFSRADDPKFLKLSNRHRKPSQEVRDALSCLTSSLSHAEPTPRNIFDWYGCEIRRHFLKNFRNGLYDLLDRPEKDGLLQNIIHSLELARGIYFSPLLEYLIPLLDRSDQDKTLVKLRRGFHMMVAYTLPWPQISALLTREITKDAIIILGIDTLKDEEETYETPPSVDDMEVDRQYSVSYRDWRDESSAETRAQMMAGDDDTQVTAARERLLSLLDGLQQVGMGGDKAQKVFADTMNSLLTEFVRAAYTSQWEGPSWATQHLRHWIENVFSRLVVQVLAVINVPEYSPRDPDSLDVQLSDVEKWKAIGIARLGALRTGELFDVIVEWPASSGAIEDLRQFTTHPAARLHLTQSFIAALNRRLLHPGASTVEILQLYISIIRAFNLLDPKGVLLDRIARPIRRYLRDRDDTVKVIVSGLLADQADTDGSVDTLVELSAELTKAHRNSLRNDRGELDWDDMNWVPDPVDAAPDYRKSKTSDVIGSLISLFESKEMFVKEMQSMLADRLLQKRPDFDQEMSVLELLKLRFGDNALQACEVMLRDIFDSRRVDTVVRNDQGLAGIRAARLFPATPDNSTVNRKPPADMPDLHAKILSHFFWPELQAPQFNVPKDISQLQQRYADGFASLKQSRKLTWLNGLGQVTVELDLEDRLFVDDVTTWQATVIYAFHSDEGSSDGTRSVDQLSSELGMSAALVRSACLFWVSKRILAEVQRDTFRVLEVLPSEDDDASGFGGPGVSGGDDTGDDNGGVGASSAESAHAAADAAAAAAAKESAEAAALEKMNLYWQFIVGMLTNQGAMPLQRIVMMLKIAVPGGFPFSNEELREFLAGMVSKGKLEIVSGGNYKIVP